jgi:hypothetical protein
MEELKELTKQERSKEIVYQVERVNLSDFGYEKSGNVKGDPKIYLSFLKRIMNGDLVAEDYNGVSEEEKIEKRTEISKLEKQEKDIEKANKKFDKDIHEKKKKIEEYNQKLLNLKEKKDEDPESAKNETFSSFKFSINLFILVMLTGYRHRNREYYAWTI